MEDILITVTEGESNEAEEFFSPKVVDSEGNSITIEIAGNNDFITSRQEGSKVKTIVYKS